MKKLFVSRYADAAKRGVNEILHLPLWQRLLHRKARRTLAVVGAGMFLMVGGSAIASSRHELSELVPVHHLLFDTAGYFLHAFGAVPILRYIEPLWLLLGGVMEEV